MNKISVTIAVRGAVQGIGYRPFAARLAEKYHLKGSVRNSGGIVLLEVTGERRQIDLLEDALRTKTPPGGLVVSVTEMPESHADSESENGGQNFRIVESSREESDELPAFPPDLGLCPDCEKEMMDPRDRRFRYGLISCVSCGPRWSILEELPYDRERTTMRPFSMCSSCRKEYESENGRRRHAQTISCHDCGPQMYFVADRKALREEKYKIRGEEGFAQAVRVLKEGGILALKGVGGYQLLCSAFCEESVQRLRRMKGREEKPFAVLFSSVDGIAEYAEISDREREALESSARPIVLLQKKVCSEKAVDNGSDFGEENFKNTGEKELEAVDGKGHKAAEERGTEAKGKEDPELAPAVCSESQYLGAFLPSFGVQELLVREAGPLVLTSANRSGEPIPYEEESFAGMEFSGGEEPDGVYLHDRRILRPLDDSVVFVENETLQMIRRSRGYVPMPVFVPREREEAGESFRNQNEIMKPVALTGASQSGESISGEKATMQKKKRSAPVIFAAGGDLKAAFAFGKNDRIILSQYLGDLAGYQVMCNYRAQRQQMERILKAEPDCVVCDLHPGYFSVAMAKEYAKEKNIPVFSVQHHQAHAASVMAEHGLVSCIGIVLDGTGCGTDGQLWGGEFLYLCREDFRRLGSLSNCRMLGGDALSVRADLPADCLRYAVSEETKNPLVGELLSQENPGRTVISTSMGRLFDAAASLLGFGQENRYEGECAILLEQAAWRAMERREETEDPASKDREEKNLTEKDQKEQVEKERRKMLAESLLSFRNLVTVSADGRLILSQEALVRGILERNRKGKDPEETALFFHLAISYGAAQIAARLSERTGEKKICLSGGCFANRLLLSSLTALLKQKGLQVYWNEQVPCNDGGIALGQAYLGRFHL